MVPEIHELTDAESRALFDEAARYYMGMSGDEFLRRYDAGEWKGHTDDTRELRRMVMLIPFGR